MVLSPPVVMVLSLVVCHKLLLKWFRVANIRTRHRKWFFGASVITVSNRQTGTLVPRKSCRRLILTRRVRRLPLTRSGGWSSDRLSRRPRLLESRQPRPMGSSTVTVLTLIAALFIQSCRRSSQKLMGLIRVPFLTVTLTVPRLLI